MMFPEQNAPGEAGAGDASGTSDSADSNYDSGFDSNETADLLEDMPQDAGADGEAAPAGEPGVKQPTQPQAPPPAAEPSQSAQQVQGEQAVASHLSSEAPVDQLLQALVQNEAAVVQAVAQQMFQLSPQDKEALENDAPAALPALGAKIYVKSLQAATALVRNMVPQMLMAEMTKYNALNSVEQAFFTHYPELNKLQHGADIVAVGQALKAQNPSLSPVDLLQRTALAVMGMHGIQRGAVAQRRGNGAFRPAASGSHMGQSSLEPEMPFAGLGHDFGE